MRTGFLLSVVIGVAGVTACASGGREPAPRSTPHRDVALVAQAPAVEIASPLELRNLRTSQKSRRTQRTRPAPGTADRQVLPAPAPKPAAATPAATLIPAAEPFVVPASASEPVNDRELPPGKTVTIIPASSGPSTGPDGVDELPSSPGRPMVRSGGTCRGRGRGPGIGIATAPRPDFR